MLIVQSLSDLSLIRSPALHSLIQNRILDIGDGFKALVVEPGDSRTSLESMTPFPLFSNPINDTVFGDEDFVPMTEVIEDHGFCYEMVFILSDDDHGTGVFVPKSSDINPTLLALCAEFAVPATL